MVIVECITIILNAFSLVYNFWGLLFCQFPKKLIENLAFNPPPTSSYNMLLRSGKVIESFIDVDHLDKDNALEIIIRKITCYMVELRASLSVAERTENVIRVYNYILLNIKEIRAAANKYNSWNKLYNALLNKIPELVQQIYVEVNNTVADIARRIVTRDTKGDVTMKETMEKVEKLNECVNIMTQVNEKASELSREPRTASCPCDPSY